MSSNSNDNYNGWSNRETWLASLWADLLSTAFHRIDWLEVISNNKS